MSKTHKLKLGFDGALERVSVKTPSDEPRPWDADDQLRFVGRAQTRIDAHPRVTGSADYSYDQRPEGMLYGRMLRSEVAAGTLRKLELDAGSDAPGVHAVLALAKPGDPIKFVGQDLVAVAATSPGAAESALERLRAHVEIEAGPFVVDTLRAAKPGAPQVHQAPVKARRTEGDEPRAEGAKASSTQRGNLRPGAPMRSGNVEAGLKQADVVHEATYTTQCHTHCALETHGVVVRWDADDALTCWASTQGIFSVRDELAAGLGLDPDKVRVITNYMGGGFGAKFGANAPGSRLGIAAAELAKIAKRPVHFMLDRREEHTVTGNRPDSVQRVRVGATRRGALTAIHVDAIGSAGTGTGAGVGRNAFAVYTGCPNRLVESADVFTHAGPGTAFRAPGHPQGAFAIESALDELARAAQLDPIELRLRHDEHPVRRHQMRLGREEFRWDERRKAAAAGRKKGTRMRTGVGMAVSIWGDFGHPGAQVTVRLTREGDLLCINGLQDIGGGITTVLAQVVGEVFAREPNTVQVKIGDSDYGPGTGSGGSQTTSTVTPAARNAAEVVRAEFANAVADKLSTKTAQVVWDAAGGARVGDTSHSFEELCAMLPEAQIEATRSRPATYGNHPMSFLGGAAYQIAGVQFAAVEVDTWTGVVRCSEVLAIHDCGRVMNPLSLRSQINGGVILGCGYALMEQRVLDPDSGRMLNANLESYKALGAMDVPKIDVTLTEVHTGNNSTGAIGIGEPSTIPTAAAIANAVGDALGVHVRSLPITPQRVHEALARLAKQTTEATQP